MFKLIYQVTDKIKEKISKLNEKGQGMVEYAIIVAVIAAIAYTLFNSDNSGLNGTISNAFDTADNNINKVASATSK